MKTDDLINKLSHNKILLYIVPNFIYLIVLFNYYNANSEAIISLLFSEVMIVGGLFFLLTNVLYLILLKVLKNRQKVFMIMVFLCAFYNTYLSWQFLLVLLLFTIILVIEFKTILNYKLDKIVFIISVVICGMFFYNVIGTAINLATILIKSTDYDAEIIVNVEEEKETPNIYYIHCDGMMSFDVMEEYFDYNNEYLKDYLKGYYINSDASLVAGHKTQRALVALFNPKYYDEFFMDYLYQLEETYLNKRSNTDYLVDYYELEEKRFNNELFNALEKKEYTTIGIGEYNAYTSFDVDYYYDYFNNFQDEQYVEIDNSQLRLITNDEDIVSRKLYTRFSHLKILFQRSFFNDFVVDLVPILYEDINYQDVDISDYTYINDVYENSGYWVPKAIIKGLEESNKIKGNKFVFVDFNLNHGPFLFDMNGNILDKNRWEYIDSYLGNYIYSSYLLTDIIDYIKNSDENSIIIIQGDHGIHMAEYEEMNEYFNISIEEAQEIRNSVISAIYIPKEYKNGDEKYLDNPLNISRYLVNNFVGDNYEYIVKE